jgi:hypothetical protein
MAKVRRFYQYRVVGTGGCMKRRLKLGTITIDRWQGKSHTYYILNLKTMKQTGWYEVYCLGDATPPQTADIQKAWATDALRTRG